MKTETSRPFRKLVPLIVAVTGLAISAQATVTVQNFWHVGEDNNVLPTDSVGSNPFDSGFGTRTASTLAHAPGGSTASLHFDGTTDGGWGGDWLNNTTVSVPSDNWAAELWVNLDSIDAGPVELLTLGNTDQAAQIGVENGNWAFVSFNWAYLNNSVAATAGSWTELAWVRDNGVNNFYVNGSLIGTDTSTLVNNGAFTLATQPGAGNREPTGYIDEIRFSTFAPGQFSTGDLMINQVPEPGTMALAGMGGGLMLLMWKNRRRV